MDKDEVILELWKILDDIDATTKLYINEGNKKYFNAIDRLSKIRWRYLTQEQVDELLKNSRIKES